MIRWFHKILLRLRSLLRRDRVEAELTEEVRFHLEKLTAEKQAQGMTAEEARYAALRELGGVEQIKEECRDMRRVAIIESLFQDLRYGLRMMAKNPAFTAIAVLTLGAGIGVNTTIFSFVQAVLLRQPPIEDPARVMTLCSVDPKGDFMPQLSAVSAPDFLDWRRQANSYSGVAALASFDFTLSGSVQPEQVPGGEVTANYFQVLGVAPIRGRSFLPGEDQPGHAKVAMLGEDLWRQLFGADPAAIGRTLKVNGEEYTLIGVVPSRFRIWMFPAQIWIPLNLGPEQLGEQARKQRDLSVFGRLKPGVSQIEAHAELAAIMRRIAADHPESNKGWGANAVTLHKYLADMSNTRSAISVLTGAVIFVLLIACANIANLLLARNTARQREFAVRAALGAGRMRLARQLLSECVLLSLAGAGLGLALSVAGLRLLHTRLNWNEFAVLVSREIYIDKSVLLFTLAVSMAAVVAFGLAPALQLARSGPAAGLKENSRTASGGRERRRLQSLLVTGEIALSLILLVGSGLFVRMFIDEVRVVPGFNSQNLLTASVTLSGAPYKEPARRAAFVQGVVRELESLPEVESVGLTRHLPFQFPDSISFTLEGQLGAAPNEQRSAGYFLISPNYFHTAQIPLLEGREFSASDNAGSAPVALVNEAFARKYFPNADALGRHIKIGQGKQTPPWSQIVGVVANIRELSGQTAPRPHIFEPMLAQPSETMKIMVRTRDDPAAFSPALRSAVFAVDKDQALTNVRTMERVIQDSGQGDDVMAELMGAFAGIALLMAAVGIYGLLAYLVGQRTQEFGVRMALGAGRWQIILMVVRNAMVWVGVGTGAGFLISLALPGLFAASFTGFHVSSGLILAGGPVVVMLVALVSSYFPARRATKVDPLTALRYE